MHFHTEYSLLDGACQVERIMSTAAELGMTQVAITDHGTLYGTIDFYKKAKAAGIKPILGCEVYMAHGSMHEKKTGANRSQSNHLVLLAENEEGYNNLIYLVSKAHLEGFYYKPRIDKELLAGHHKGLIALAACLKGEVTGHCANNNLDAAAQAADEYVQIMGQGNFYLEVQDHGLPEQKIANKNVLLLAKRMNLPLVATNDVHYLKAEHAEAHEVLLCLQTQTVMTDEKRMKYSSDQFYMKSGAEMRKLFGEIPEALANTLVIADRCNVELELGKKLHFPTYQVPEGFQHKEYLIKIAQEGLKLRYGIEDVDRPKNEAEKRISERFYYELGIIEKTKFINYFLVVWDFIHFAKNQRIPVGPGRGSGAGSIVAYALGITGIDPLHYNLIFERFLNPERVSPPDFDIDFCQTRRGEVIEYVKQKYGRDNVAQIVTFGTLGAKTVIRDIGRVLEIPLQECDRLAKMVPEDPKMTLEKALEQNPEFREMAEKDANAKRILKYARVLEGLPRNPGTHAAGVVIGEKPLIELVPLSRDKDKEIITQFEMVPLEQVGLLKMDFLGLKTLTVIQEAVDNIKLTCDLELDIMKIPVTDPETFALLNRGDTVGVFQVESPGMRDLLKRISLTCVEELIAMIALYRPGPMDMIPDYIDRKHGKVKIQYAHPLLEPVLKETYGVMIYQEQVQQAANILAGFSLGQGDILRRAMGKKKAEEMAKQRSKFVDGCVKTNKIPEKKAGEIFDTIERFAGYGFNKSHSAAYGIVSFQTAYLKAHHPAEFMAAMLSSEMGNTEKLPGLVAEAQEMDIPILAPNVNDSDVRFKPVKDGIRYGLAGVKNVGTGAVEALVKERRANGPYKGLVDFCIRVDSQAVNRKTLESLVRCGAFDFTGLSRGRLFHGVDYAMSRAGSIQRDRKSGQASLFDMLGASSPEASTSDDLPPGEAWPESQMLSAEKELLGFYISGHPLTAHAWTLKQYSLADPQALDKIPSGAQTRIGGLVSQLQKRFTKKSQKPMAVFRLEHLYGSFEVVVFPDTFENFGVHLKEEAPVMVCGELVQAEGLRMKAAELYPLADVPKFFSKSFNIHIPTSVLDDRVMNILKEILLRHRGDTQVILCLQFPSGEKVFMDTHRSFKVSPSEKLIHEIEHILGEDCVYLDINKAPCRRPPAHPRNGNGF
ncbi:MAG: DNA polymerase III subunit alpha [Lentisphaerae bacterium GWF2_57_35]|nr:MAG: DNA polymerase III subunit alpha [Lentisphaerae bacterium GWF2_57_35]